MAVSINARARSAANLTLRAAPRLSRWVQTQMTRDDDHDLSLRQLSALQHIDGTETTLGDVARSLNVTPAVVTGLIDRLERRGYVRRVNSLFDRRRVNIELTPAGEDVRMQAEGRLANRLQSLIGDLPSDEVARLEDGLQILEKVVRSIDAQRGERGVTRILNGS